MLVFGGETLLLLLARADNRHLLRHLLLGAGGRPAGDVAGRVARAVHQAEEEKKRRWSGAAAPDRKRRRAASFSEPVGIQRLGNASVPCERATGKRRPATPPNARLRIETRGGGRQLQERRGGGVAGNKATHARGAQRRVCVAAPGWLNRRRRAGVTPCGTSHREHLLHPQRFPTLDQPDRAVDVGMLAGVGAGILGVLGIEAPAPSSPPRG